MLNFLVRRGATTSTNARRPFALAAGVTAMFLALLMPASAAYAASTDVVGGQLDWGFKASFVNYITGPIAKGSYETTGGATAGFTFPGATGTADGESFSVSVAGGVQFRGHDYGKGHLLELNIGNIRIARTGSTGTLTADVTSRSLSDEGEDGAPGPINSYPSVLVANLDFSGAGSVVEGGTTTYTNIPATLDAGAVEAFAQFYQPGEALDPVTVTLVTGSGDDTTPGEGTATTTTTAPTATTTTVVDVSGGDGGATPTTAPGGTAPTTSTVQPSPSSPGAVAGQGGAAARTTSLPRTGSSPTLITVGLALVVAGGTAAAAGRRMRTTDA